MKKDIRRTAHAICVKTLTKNAQSQQKPRRGTVGIEGAHTSTYINKLLTEIEKLNKRQATWIALLMTEFIIILILYKYIINLNDAAALCHYLKGD